jgi:hypothetical protein
MATDTLCSYCQALIIDDSKYFDGLGMDENGEIDHLKYFEGLIEIKNDEKVALWKKDYMDKLPLDYRREDTYPDFPALKLSAEKGCSFCGLLRTATLNKYKTELDDRYSKVNKLELNYKVLFHGFEYCGQKDLSKFSLLLLTGSFDVPDLDGPDTETITRYVCFDLEAEKGFTRLVPSLYLI